ncbi:MAG: hypothetical protein ACR2LE_03965 [Nocardioidaceae bacterium]
MPRDSLPDALRVASGVLPLSYAVDAMQRLQNSSGLSDDLAVDLLIITAFIGAAVALGAATLRRRTA